MQRDLVSFEFPPHLRTSLTKAGFRALSDLVGISPIQLAKEAGISKEDALSVLKITMGNNVINNSINAGNNTIAAATSITNNNNNNATTTPAAATNGGVSVLDLLKQQTTRRRHVFTFSDELDNILGGGVPIGELTEFCGPPGVGKTQIGIQLCVDACLPLEFGGLGGEAVYIDTEGSFMIERVIDIASSFSQHVKRMAEKRNNASLMQVAAALSSDAILSRIYCFRVEDFVEQLALTKTLPSFLDAHTNIKIIIVDSVTFHFRHDFEDMSERSRLLVAFSQQFASLAKKYGIAVVFVNQVTTKVGLGGTYLAPSLGESWGHACVHRVLVSWANDDRVCRLYKSPSLPPAVAKFTITAHGIRSIHSKKRPRDPSAKTNE